MHRTRRRRAALLSGVMAGVLFLASCTGGTGSSSSSSSAPAADTAVAASGGAPAASGAAVANPNAAAGLAQAGQPQGPFTKHADGKLKIGWVALTADCQSCVQALAEFNKYIKDNKYDWTVTVVDSKGDAATAAATIEDFTTRKVDAIVTAFVVLRAAGSAISGAKAAGIPIFSLDSGWSPGIVGDVTTDNFAMAGEMASYMADSLGGKGNVVVIWSDQHYGVVIRNEMINTIIKSRYPGIKILASQDVTLAGYFQESTAAAEAFVSRFGKQINAVYCGFDEPCLAAAAVFKKAGLNVPMYGFDSHQQAMTAIRTGDGKSGLVASMAQQFGPFATTVGSWIQKIMVEGQSVSSVIPVPEVYLPAKLITPLNVPAAGIDGWTVPDYYDFVNGTVKR